MTLPFRPLIYSYFYDRLKIKSVYMLFLVSHVPAKLKTFPFCTCHSVFFNTLAQTVPWLFPGGRMPFHSPCAPILLPFRVIVQDLAFPSHLQPPGWINYSWSAVPQLYFFTYVGLITMSSSCLWQESTCGRWPVKVSSAGIRDNEDKSCVRAGLHGAGSVTVFPVLVKWVASFSHDMCVVL